MRSMLILAALLLAGGFGVLRLATTPTVQADAINSTDFVITVDTTKTSAGSSTDTRFTIPTTGAGYNYTVDCNNDGVIDATGQTASYTCNYPTAGKHTVRIGGTFPRIYFNNSGDRLKLITINQWGTSKWTSMGMAFYGCADMDVVATDVPDLSGAKDLGFMFRGATNLKGAGANWSWHTSTITSMPHTFNAASSFNQDLSSWDVGNVTTMDYAFRDAISFNQNVRTWNTAKVKTMQGTFMSAAAFNQDIGAWNTSSVTDMRSMFASASSFNQNINNWNTSSVTYMASMFNGATAFNQPLNSWDVSKVTTTAWMFQAATSFNQNLNAWNTSSVNDVSMMFYSATSFNQPIGGWNTASVTSMVGMFNNAKVFNQYIGDWNTSNVTTMNSMFQSNNVFNQDISKWNTSSLKNMRYMFRDAKAFNQAIGRWNTSSVTNMDSTFYGASSFNQNLEKWNTSSVTDMNGMFSTARAFNQPIGSWDVSKVTNMSNMLNFSAISTVNYDATLIAWSDQTLKPSISLGASGLTYCTAESARANVITSDSWRITDSGKNCTAYQPKTTTYTGTTTFDSTAAPQMLGTLATNDTDAAAATLDTFKYSLTCATPSAEDSYFSLSGNTLSLARSPIALSGMIHACVRVTNSQGQTLDTVLPFTVLEKTPPSTPTSAPDMLPSSDSGASNTDNLTNVTTPTFTLTCTEQGGRVTLYVDGVAHGTANCTSVGSVTVTVSPALTNGTYAMTYTETDANGNESATSPSVSITIDTTAPATPVITIADVTADNTINIAESQADQTITGTITGAAAGDTVTVTVNGISHTATLAGDGSWSVTIPGSDLASDADHTVAVAITIADAAGNTATAAATKSYTVDTNVVAAPAMPVLDPKSDTGTSSSDGITSNATPTITIVCSVVGDNLTFYDNGHALQTIACTDVGTQPITLDALSEGEHKISYIATTATGNTSAVSQALHLVIDTTAPAGTLTTVTSDTVTPTFSGTIDDPTATITVRIGDIDYTATNNGDGTWTLPSDLIVPALTDGAHDITLIFTDAAGNNTTTHATLTIELPKPPVSPTSSTTGEQLRSTGTSLIAIAFGVLGCVVGAMVLVLVLVRRRNATCSR